MAKIHLHFGQPLLDDGIDSLERWAYNQEVSIETANINSFKTVMSVLIKVNSDGDSYFDLCLYPMFDEKLELPRIIIGYYEFKRKLYPKITIQGDHIRGLETKKDYFITDEIVNQLGKHIEDDFDFEFVESKRVGKTAPKNNEVIYLLGDIPHIHHNNNFIEIKTNAKK
jgi:hypothetical protein